ncbi:class II fructose-bisphosphate aldolase [Intrasporangium calvum]|uniref:Class II fructose-bisphosphate aldolase n=1 Tax=Intrasporangium calvum TaxID=53358 RepID=A0ABT5GFC6_9MICO|nr:class II fructose-bisphosphate aldolase [Intrasporangium calvum]MDC5696812.1 class II fructose-bisphosphate aldolase [Intrasporangium calvum]
MLDTGLGTIQEAYAQGWALAAFSTYGLETTMGVVRAAEAAGAPIILQAGSSTFAHAGRAALAALALHAAEAASVRVGVHLDHSRDLEEIRWCAESGYSSVMVDGSGLPFEENIALTREAVAIGAANGVWVEGELGSVPGDEDRSVVTEVGQMTDPARAREFVDRTGVSALAVAVGNVHGMASEPQPLALELLTHIRDAVGVPLVLHGASGLPDDELRAVLERGVAKVNINTELRRALLQAFHDLDEEVLAKADLARALADGVVAVQQVAHQKIVLLSRPALQPPDHE